MYLAQLSIGCLNMRMTQVQFGHKSNQVTPNKMFNPKLYSPVQCIPIATKFGVRFSKFHGICQQENILILDSYAQGEFYQAIQTKL